MELKVRPLNGADTEAALQLYVHLTLGPKTVSARDFKAVLEHPGTVVFGVESGKSILGMVTLHVLPNVTWGGRPYALIENVVTHPAHRGKGLGRKVLEAALNHAWRSDVYKVMLLTGQKRGAKGFYESVGFSSEDKHAMVIRRT